MYIKYKNEEDYTNRVSECDDQNYFVLYKFQTTFLV